jgi:hypothetical protein
MICIFDVLYLFWESLNGVCRHEPRCLDAVSLQQIEQAIDADRRAEDAAGYICHAGDTPVFRIYPDGSLTYSELYHVPAGSYHPLTVSTSIPYPTSTSFPMLAIYLAVSSCIKVPGCDPSRLPVHLGVRLALESSS